MRVTEPFGLGLNYMLELTTTTTPEKNYLKTKQWFCVGLSSCSNTAQI